MYKNSIHMFTALNTGIKFPFALDKLTAALPLSQHADGGTVLHGVGIPNGIQVKETATQINELYGEWFKSNVAGVAGRA